MRLISEDAAVCPPWQLDWRNAVANSGDAQLRAVSLWGAGFPHRIGPLVPGHRLLRRTDLPCVPCVRNQCPRRGRGTILPEAERECMALLEVDQVWREITGASR